MNPQFSIILYTNRIIVKKYMQLLLDQLLHLSSDIHLHWCKITSLSLVESIVIAILSKCCHSNWGFHQIVLWKLHFRKQMYEYVHTPRKTRSSLGEARPRHDDNVRSDRVERVNIDAGSLQWWTTTRRPQRRPDSRRRRRTRPADTVGRRDGLSRRPIRRARLTCTARAPPPQQQPQPRIPQSQATSRPQLARSPPRPRSPRSPYPVPRSTTVP